MTLQVDALMRAYDGDVPGASVLVLRDGEPVVRRSYGFADLEEHVAATPSTNYRLASVTKQFTAAAILLLAEDGRLKIGDRVRKWLPSLPDAAEAITIRHLLTHTSGLIDYEDVIPESMTGQLHDADVLAILESQNRTYFPPGTDYRYSNSGYALLALIVERASGRSFASLLRERIFLPLGMNNTVAYEQGISTVANRAFGYSEVAVDPAPSNAAPEGSRTSGNGEIVSGTTVGHPASEVSAAPGERIAPGPTSSVGGSLEESANARWTRTDQSQTSAVLGDGGIYSSIDDLAKWDAALYDDRLLSARSRKLAFTPATPTDDPNVEYGFGWRITGETLWHSGETIGFRNVIVRYPQRHMTVIVLTNRDDPEPYRTALAIAKVTSD